MTGYVTIADLQRACPLLIVAGTSTRSQCGLQASVATLDFPHRFWHGSSYSYRCIHSLSWRYAHLAAARTFITVRLRARLLVVSNAPRPTHPNSNVFGFALSPVPVDPFADPNANGCGLLVEQIAPAGSRRPGTAAQFLRVDWHRFRANVGRPGRPYEHGGVSRHPPAVDLNLPHLDFPHHGIRHWPWRQHSAWLLPRLIRRAAREQASATPPRAAQASPRTKGQSWGRQQS